MGLVVVVLVVALGLGSARGGRLAGLERLGLRARWLLAVALLVQLAGGVVGGAAYPVGLALSALLVVAFLAGNRGLRGGGLVALGLLANALVVGLNGAMPVALSAAARAGVTGSQLDLRNDPRHEAAGPSTRLRWLGDVVPVALPLRPEVVSPGDVLVAAGLAQVVVVAMGATRPRTGPGRDCATLVRTSDRRRTPMAKKGRKKRARKKSKANHGNRPNA